MPEKGRLKLMAATDIKLRTRIGEIKSSSPVLTRKLSTLTKGCANCALYWWHQVPILSSLETETQPPPPPLHEIITSIQWPTPREATQHSRRELAEHSRQHGNAIHGHRFDPQPAPRNEIRGGKTNDSPNPEDTAPPQTPGLKPHSKTTEPPLQEIEITTTTKKRNRSSKKPNPGKNDRYKR